MTTENYVPQRFLANDRNLVRTATLVASAVQSIANTVVELPVARAGTAKVDISGTYTGTADASYDFQILDTSATTKLVSSPVFTGAGSESLSGLGVTTASAQDFTVDCNSAGTPAITARADIGGAIVVARQAGTGGNDIHIAVDESALVFSDTFPNTKTYSLLHDVQKGDGSATKPLVGPEFDYDTATMGADNVVPGSALRVAFDGDLTNIYLQYKVFKDGQAQYFFIPELQLDYKASTKVQYVTGARSVTISNIPPGATTETLPGIITVYDLLNAIRTTSNLLDVDGVVVNDRSPNGQAARELNLRTVAHYNPSTGTGSKAATGFVDITVGPAADTQLITATCIAVSAQDDPTAYVGHELWKLDGNPAIKGTRLFTAVPFSVTDFGFTIPQVLPDTSGSGSGKISAEITFASRPSGVTSDFSICAAGMKLGPSAVDQTVTFVYTQRPASGCDCKDMAVPDLDGACLGTTGTGDGMSDYTAANRVRLTTLYAWYADTLRTNSSQGTGKGDYDLAPLFVNPVVRHARTDIVDLGVAKFNAATSTAISLTGTTFSSTVSGAAVSFDTAGQQVSDSLNGLGTENKFYSYTPFNPEPLADTVGRFEKVLKQINDLTDLTLQAAGETNWDTAVTEMEGDVTAQLTGSTTVTTAVGYTFGGTTMTLTGTTIKAQTAITQGQLVMVYDPGDGVLVCRPYVGGYSGLFSLGYAAAAISLGANGTIVFNGENVHATITGTDNADAGKPCTGLADSTGDYHRDSGDSTVATGFTITAAGKVLHSLTPAQLNWVTQTVTTTTGGGTPNRLATLTERYKSRLNWVLISSGISPVAGKADASNDESGDGCWRDYGDPFYWVVKGSVGGEYAPAFTNHPYWGSIKVLQSTDPSRVGKVFSTHEFALQINVKCPAQLLVGDTITVTIGNAAKGGVYQIGDVLSLPIIAAQDLKLLGGTAANLLQTWNINGSVDGPFPSYSFDPSAPTAYNQNGLQMQLIAGGVPAATGDKFVFSVTGGHYEWRVNGGAWSAPLALPSGPTAFDAGLSFEFVRGVEPNFVVGDVYSFKVLQPWSADNVRVPTRNRWFPGTSSPFLEIQFLPDADHLGGIFPVDSVAIGLHSIPSGATITLTGGTIITAGVGVMAWSEIIPWQEGLIVYPLTMLRNAAFVRITVASGADTSFGYVWAGQALATSLACDVQLKRNYKVERGTVGGLIQGGKFLGKAVNASVQWQEGMMTEDDAAAISALLDQVKSNDDEPLIFVPQFERPQDSIFATVVEDEVEVTDEFTYHPDAAAERRLSVKMTLQGVWR